MSLIRHIGSICAFWRKRIMEQFGFWTDISRNKIFNMIVLKILVRNLKQIFLEQKYYLGIPDLLTGLGIS